MFTTTTDGTIYALDDETLKALWSFNTGSFSSAPPMTYSVNGKQYVAVLIGGNVVDAGHLLDKTPSDKDCRTPPCCSCSASNAARRPTARRPPLRAAAYSAPSYAADGTDGAHWRFGA